MKGLSITLLIAAALVASSNANAQAFFHVAPAPIGNDTQDGSNRTPFATLDRARRAVRAYLASHDLRSDVVVEHPVGTGSVRTG
jgi:hypothetical protein